MSARPILLDLFCCEGGASVGYSRAGFDVIGVELDPAPLRRYPFPWINADALGVLRALIAGDVLTTSDGGVLDLGMVAVIAASPPCQAYSQTRHTHSVEHARLVEPVRELLRATGKPYVIENVVGAPLLDPLRLCGSEFGLSAFDEHVGGRVRLERHRLFESNVYLHGAGGCRHDKRVQVAGVYGAGNSDLARAKNVRHGGYVPGDKRVRAALLGADWMTNHGQQQSIPPAYTEFIGEQLLDALVLA